MNPSSVRTHSIKRWTVYFLDSGIGLPKKPNICKKITIEYVEDKCNVCTNELMNKTTG